MNMNKIIKALVVALFVFSSSFAIESAKIPQVLLWPKTPPGAKEGDAEKAEQRVATIKNGTHKAFRDNLRNIRVPAMDVYLPTKETQTGVAMVLFCGGAYRGVAIGAEGLLMQKFLNERGIAVFMVAYRCEPFNHPVPLWDAQRAMRIVRSRAREFGIDPNKIGAMGFSAGGHVVSTLSVHYDEAFDYTAMDEIDQVSARPDFTCLIYPLISMRTELTHAVSRKLLLGGNPSEELIATLSNNEQVDKNTPPAFLAHGTADDVVHHENCLRYHEACRKKGVETQLLLVKNGKHGPGKLDGKPSIRMASEEYVDSMLKWIEVTLKSPP